MVNHAKFSKMATEWTNVLDKGEKKRQAVSYLKQNGIPKCIENLLNTVVNDNPNDLFGFMAEYFDQLAISPSIAKVVASEIFSSRGYPSFQVKIECLIHGTIQGLSCLTAPTDGKPTGESRQSGSRQKGRTPVPGSEIKLKPLATEHGSKSETENEADKVETLISNINCDINSMLVGCKVFEQQEVDSVLQNMVVKSSAENETAEPENEETTTIDESQPNDEEPSLEDWSLPETRFDALTVSLAIADSAAYLKKRQLYDSLYTMINNKEPCSLCLPTPMMTVLGSGKRTSGKLYIIKEVMIFVKQNMLSLQALKQLTNIYQHLETIVQQKTPTANTTLENGVLAPPMDRPEQVLDIIREAVTLAGYAHDSDVSVALRCSSADVYDKDKQKYEICASTFKSSDELINVYGDLCERYPEIKVIVDPLVAEDRPGWSKLNEKIGEKCFLINDQTFPRKRSLLENVLSEKLVSGCVMRTQDSSTVTEFLEQTKPFEDQPRILLISQNEVVGQESYMVDMAAASEADFVIFGSPVRSEHVAKYNRLIDIERDLVTSGKFQQRQPLVPPFVDAIDEKQCEET